MDVTINSRKFQTGKLSAFQQFHIWRRIMPVAMALGVSMKTALAEIGPLAPPAGASPEEVEQVMQKAAEQAEDALMRAIQPSINILSKMSDEDAEYIIKTCMSVCSMASGAAFAPIMAPNGALMFQELGVAELLQLSASVIKDNLGNFFDALPTLN